MTANGTSEEQPACQWLEEFRYDDAIVRAFALATLVWGLVAMLVGLIIAHQLTVPALNFGMGLTSFGRLRPLHTNAAIFAFAGNAIFAAVYYSTQRLCKARMWSDRLSWAHFWGWQAIIVSAAITLPLGITQSKEYAELEWPIDLAIAVVWAGFFGVNFFMTLLNRRERHLYVALWFYIATIVTVTVLHLFNNLVVPVGFFKSYSVYAGVQDAFMQWWYGHNAVAFFLTTPFLGLMYYFLPKAAERPVFSYKLSILHFWSLVFLYIWAGPHHLHYSPTPEWASTLGMLFSIMLWMPSWGGMINGLLTLRGAWRKVTVDPVLKFYVVGITFYGMSTFEGPLLSVKAVNALSHYTDWTIAHVHSGALGWNGMMTFGMLYWLLPRIFQTKLWSTRLAEWHFWLGTVGILLYIVPIYVAGLTQGLMWRAINEQGQLMYPDFVETVRVLIPLYWLRILGGFAFFAGVVLLGVNFLMTWRLPACSLRRPGLYRSPAAERVRRSSDRTIETGRRARHSQVARCLVAAGVAPPLGTSAGPVHGLGGDRSRRGLAVRNHPDVPDPLQRPDDCFRQTLHAARTCRSRPLRRLRLLQLPLADDPTHARRDQAVRRILQAGRVHLRPTVPMGLPPDRAGSRPRRGSAVASLAPDSLPEPQTAHSRLDHAGLPGTGAGQIELPNDPGTRAGGRLARRTLHAGADRSRSDGP